MLKRVGQIALGVALGLLLAEVAFWLRDGGAFPHVNFYVADDALGVRLSPHSSERLAVGRNPISTASTNALGFRGGDWPAPTGDDVIVVGDSQVFGLGVEDDQTFSAKLRALNAGVPTYGPREYLATAAEVLKTRGKARHVVFVLNAANDYFELDRPNRERHAVWDGWAVRKETAPERVTWFPFREAIMGRSHFVYALRRAVAEAQLEGSLRSEGEAKDLFERGAEFTAHQAQVSSDRDAGVAALNEAARILYGVEEPAPEVSIEDVSFSGRGPLRGVSLERAAKGHPGDIVFNGLFEGSRPVTLTADMIQEAARQLTLSRAEYEKERAAQHQALAQARARFETDAAAARATVQRLRWSLPPPTAPLPKTLERFRELLVAFQQEHHVEVTLVVLPLDVQVSDDEWKKYGQSPRSMDASLAYSELLVEAVRASGLRAVHLATPLAHGEPGVFLDGDLHLTAKGHQIVANELAALLATPAPRVVRPLVTKPPPSPATWDTAPLVEVAHAAELNCEVRKAEGWSRVLCRPLRKRSTGGLAEILGPSWWVALAPMAVELRTPNEDAWVTSFAALNTSVMWPDSSALTAKFDFERSSVRESWELRTTPRLEFVRLEGAARSEGRRDFSVAAAQFVSCSDALLRFEYESYGDPSPECFEAFSDCAEWLACAQGHPQFRPPCARGWTASGRCR